METDQFARNTQGGAETVTAQGTDEDVIESSTFIQ